MKEKKVFPDMDIEIFMIKGRDIYESDLYRVKIETWLRLKHEGKYFLTGMKMQNDIKANEGMQTAEAFMDFTKIFCANVYKYLKLLKVDTNMKLHQPGCEPVDAFVMDLDQLDELERLGPTSDYNPNIFRKR